MRARHRLGKHHADLEALWDAVTTLTLEQVAAIVHDSDAAKELQRIQGVRIYPALANTLSLGMRALQQELRDQWGPIHDVATRRIVERFFSFVPLAFNALAAQDRLSHTQMWPVLEPFAQHTGFEWDAVDAST